MNQGIIISLVQNIAILLAMVFVYSLLLRNRKTDKLHYKIIVGLVNGMVGILLMWTALHLDNGVIFDTRSILISVSGLLFGIIPTVLSAIVMILYRISLGGPGMIVGVVVVITTSIIGIWANRYLLKRILDNLKNRGIKIYMFGVVVHINMLLCMFLLPSEIRWETLSSIALPVITLYPLGTYLLCKIWLDQMERQNLNRRIAESEAKYRNLAENTSDIIWTMDTDFNLTYVSPACERIFGESPEAFMSKPIFQRIVTEDIDKSKDYLNELLESDMRPLI
jgi:LytS/YehU family sensor histidine kinase